MDLYKAFLAAIILTLLTACGGGGTGGGYFNYTGQWSGTINDSVAGAGSVNMTITQSGNNLAGTWQATFSQANSGGSLTGSINDNSVIVQLNPSNVNACPYNVVATRNGNTMTGNYSAFNCTGTVTGTLSLSKQ